MKVLMLTHEYPPMFGGVSTYCAEISEAVSRLGHEVHVVAPNGAAPAEAAGSMAGSRVEIARFNGSVYSWRSLPRFAMAALRHAAMGRFDIVHALDWPSFMTCSAYCRVGKLSFVATVHGTEIGGMKSSSQVRILCGRDWYRRPARIVTNSAFTRETVLREWSDSIHDRVSVTHLGVNEYWHQSASARDIQGVHDRFDLAPGCIVLLTVARIDRRKGQDLVLKALGRLPGTIAQRIVYVIVGKGDGSGYERELREMSETAPSRVVFTGPLSRDEVRALYSLATCVVMPGRRYGDRIEGFGLAYLEAAAQGTPSIAARVGAAEEVVCQEQTGLIVDEEDVDQLSASIRRIVEEPELRTRMGDAARRWASGFTWKKCAEQTVAAYLEARSSQG